MRARSLLAVALAGMAALAAAAPAGAVDPWWGPLQAVAGSEGSGDGQLAVTSAGEPVVVWVRGGPAGSGPAGALMATVARPDGSTGDPTTLGTALLRDVVARPGGGVTVAWTTADGAVEVSDRPAGGAFGPAHELAGPGTAIDWGALRLVSDTHGDQALMVPGGDGEGGSYLRYNRPAGGEWTGPVTVSPPDGASWDRQTGMANDGRVVEAAVSAEGGTSHAVSIAVTKPDGQERTTTLPTGDLIPDDPHVAVSANGDAVVLWGERAALRSDGTPAVNGALRSVRIPAGAMAPGAPATVPGADRLANNGQVAMLDSGAAIFLYTKAPDDGYDSGPVMIVDESRPSAPAPQLLAASQAGHLRLALDGQGGGVATWQAWLRGPVSTQRRADGSWTPVGDLYRPCSWFGEASALAVGPGGEAVALTRGGGNPASPTGDGRLYLLTQTTVGTPPSGQCEDHTVVDVDPGMTPLAWEPSPYPALRVRLGQVRRHGAGRRVKLTFTVRASVRARVTVRAALSAAGLARRLRLPTKVTTLRAGHVRRIAIRLHRRARRVVLHRHHVVVHLGLRAVGPGERATRVHRALPLRR